MAFELAQLANINAKVDQMGADVNLMKQFQPKVEGLQTIINNQTAVLDKVATELADSTKNKDQGKVFVNWLTADAIVEGAVVPNCTLDGPELDAASRGYDLSMEFKTDFSLDKDDLKNTIYSTEEVVARGMLKALQVMDEAYAKRALAKLDAYAGNNPFLGGFTQSAGLKTQIPAAQYNEALFPYLAMAAEINRLGNYYLLDNGSLFQGKYIADMNRANGEGKGIANMYDDFNIKFDLHNFAKAAITTDTFIVDANGVFFATKNRFTNDVPKAEVGQLRYRIKSRTLPNVFYDVYYKEECIVVGSEDHVKQTFRLQTKGDLLLAPERTYSSVIALEKV